MDEHPGGDTIEQGHLDQLIDRLPPGVAERRDLLEFFIQRLVAARPIDLGTDRGEEERDDIGQIGVAFFFPRPVEIAHR